MADWNTMLEDMIKSLSPAEQKLFRLAMSIGKREGFLAASAACMEHAKNISQDGATRMDLERASGASECARITIDMAKNERLP